MGGDTWPKKSCPRCSSPRTKKKGFTWSSSTTVRGVKDRKLQRFLCRDCKKSFTFEVKGKRKRHSTGFIRSAIKRYMEDNTTLRSVSHSIGLSHRGLLNWIVGYGDNCKSPLEVSLELSPIWSGLLGVDGKELKIKGKEHTLLIAQDILTFDPVFFSLVDGENVEDSRRFFMVIRDVFKYPMKGIVSDLGRGRVFISIIEDIFPNAPHQACVIHFSRYVDTTIPKSKKSVYYKENRLLRDTVNNILFAQSFNDAHETFQRLLSAKDSFKAPYQKRVLKSLERHFDLLTAHFHDPFLVRDNNVTENLIKQLNRKLKQSGSFKSFENAYGFLKLWFIYYRFKAFTNSSEPYRNGRAPLELAKANIRNLDWLHFSQRARPS